MVKDVGMLIDRRRVVLIIVVAVMAGGGVCLVTRERAKIRAERLACGSYMVSIGLAARMWANDNGERMPLDLLSISNEINTTKVLFCPGDHSRRPPHEWTSFTVGQSSFEIVTPGLRDGETNSVFLRCKIHGNVGYADGSVFVEGRRHRK